MSTDNLAGGWAKALGGNRKQFDMFFDRMLDGFAYNKIIIDKEGKPIDYVFLEVNHAFEKMTGLKREQIIGKKVTEVFLGIEKDPADWIGVYGKVALTGVPVQFENYFELLGKWYNVSAYCPEKGHIVTIFEDITERKKAEKETFSQKQKAEDYLNIVGNIILALNHNGKITLLNKRGYEILGYEQGELQGADWIETCLPPETKDELKRVFQGWVEGKTSIPESYENLIISKSGDRRLISWHNTELKDNEGRIIGTLSSGEDVTEHKKAEDDLRESEQRLRFHAENIPLAVVEWDRNFVVTRWAGDAQKMFGWTASETIGKPIMDLHMIYEADIPAVEKTMGRLTRGEIQVVSSNRNITKDGKVIYCTWYNSVLLDEKGKMTSVFSFVEDKTAMVIAENTLEENNKNLEKLIDEGTKQLKDSERLAAIGATAGMVGHDIRNPLQAITGDLYLAKTELAAVPECDEKTRVLENLTEIEKNVDYINKIVADLQDFAKPLHPHGEEADLKLIIDELLAKNSPPKNIKLIIKVEDGARKVMADSTYINRILYNLVTNAVQAMPKGGQLIINACRDKKTNGVVLTVVDTGVGIPEAAKAKLFTPMFTTKSKGQGFGLAVVKRMAESLGGSVSFESEEGKGTAFTVRLLPTQSGMTNRPNI